MRITIRSNISLEKLKPGTYCGTTERRLQVPGLLLAETRYPAGLVIPPHEHTNPFLGVLLEGCFTQSCERKSWTGRPLTLTIFPAGVPHANRWHDSGGRVLHVEFGRAWINRLADRAKVLNKPAHYDRGLPRWLSHRIAAEFRRNDNVSALAIEGLVLELLAECSRSAPEDPVTHPPRWLHRVCELLQQRFNESLSLEEIAGAVGISADHLARSFRRCQGCTVGEHVRRLRVEFACRKLVEETDPLAIVALDAGFADQSHFAKTFKRYMGVTPAAFRALNGRRKTRTKP